jgi:hypothetical protein
VKRSRATEIHALLCEIDQAIAAWYAGEEPAGVMQRLDEKIGELRDALWHELPRDVALRMDREDGLPADRGYRNKLTSCTPL